MQSPPFIPISIKDMNKYLKCLYTPNIWLNLLTYDELTINVRQKEDSQYAELLARFRLGIITAMDVKTLLERRMIFKTTTPDERLHEICDYLAQLPSDSVCLLPTRKQSEDINRKMLDRISTPYSMIELLATDEINGNDYTNKRAAKFLNKYEDDSSMTAGLQKKIMIKIGAKVMIRRNIDTTIGLVNGAVGIITDVERNADNKVTKLIIEINSSLREISQVTSKFQILPKIYVHRTQFPITLAYGMTIHKSQGLSLKNCLIDIGEQIFACGQSYVALSRVTSLNGLHLINFNPEGVKALNTAIQEYNRLRKESEKDFKVLLDSSTVKKNSKIYKILDAVWYELKHKNSEKIQNEVNHAIITDCITNMPPMYSNINGVSTYAISVFQCLFNSKPIIGYIKIVKKSDVDDNDYWKKHIHEDSDKDIEFMKMFISLSKKHIESASNLDTSDVCAALGKKYVENTEHNVTVFLTEIMEHCAFLRNNTQIDLEISRKCVKVSCGKTAKQRCMTHILPLHVQDTKNSIGNLLNFSKKWKISETSNLHNNVLCSACNYYCNTKSQILNSGEMLIVHVLISEHIANKDSVLIDGIPNTLLTINKDKYQLNSAIFSTNSSCSSKKTNYKSILRKGKQWYSISDEIKCVRWPAGSKNVKLLFYEKIQKRKM